MLAATALIWAILGGDAGEFAAGFLATLACIGVPVVLSIRRTGLNHAQRKNELEARIRTLEERSRARDEVLATMSHEFKTSLNGVLGFAESLLLGAYGKITEEQEEAVGSINACAGRLCKLTESLLRFYRLEGDVPEPLYCESVSLRDHVEEAIVDLRAIANRQGLRIVNAVPPDLVVTCNIDCIEQVVRILVDNGIKYTPGGRIEILARRWDGVAPQGFQLAVRDSGLGIPAEFHTRIFEPFVQGIGHENRFQGGVGLGLAIAKRLATRLSAEILVESQVGKGSTFTVLVPEGAARGPLRAAFLPWPSEPREELAPNQGDAPRASAVEIPLKA